MSVKRIHVVKKCVFIMLIVAVFFGMILFFVYGRQKVHCATGTDNLGTYYILEFEKLNRADSYMIPACRGDVFAVNFKIEKGHADFLISRDGRNPIYRGNDIEAGTFDVIVPEDGEYRITVNAKHASGSIEVYAKKGKGIIYED